MARRSAAQKRALKKAQRASAARRRKGRKPRRRAARRASASTAASQQLQANPTRRRRRRKPARRRRSSASLSANALLKTIGPLLENKRRYSAAEEELEENPRRRRRRRRAKKAAPRRRRRRRALAANPRRRRRRAKAAPRRRMRRNPTTKIILQGNPWHGNRRGHRRAAKKGWAAKRRRHGRKRAAPRRRSHRRRSRRSSELMLENPMMLENPSSGFLPNQIAGAYTRQNLMAYGTAAAGVAVGLLVADFVDRFVATRKPADSTSADAAKAVGPWYGRDAAAAQRMRPDAWRLGAQAAGAVVALGLAYWTRGQRLLPFLLGGTAIGFGSNLLKKLADWWLMPTLLKAKDPTEISFANRMYPLEQMAIQDEVTGMFAAWGSVPGLQAGQTDPQIAQSPINGTAAAPGTDVYTLGKGETGALGAGGAFGGRRQRHLVKTGRLGNCSACGGHDGCYNDCPTQCPDCSGYNPNKKCLYTWQAGDDLYAMAQAGGVDVNVIIAMNGGTTPDMWTPGMQYTMPYGVCDWLQNRTQIPNSGVPTGVPYNRMPVPPGYLPFTPQPIPAPGVGPFYTSFQPQVPGPMVPAVVAGAPNGNGNGNVAAPQESQPAPTTPQPQAAAQNGNGHAQSAPQAPSIYSIGVRDE